MRINLVRSQKKHTFAVSFCSWQVVQWCTNAIICYFLEIEKRLAVMLASSFLRHRTQVRRYIFIFHVTKVTVTVFWVSNMGFSKKNLQNIITIYIIIYIVKFSIQLFSANYRNCNCHYCNKLSLLAQGDKIASHVWKNFFSRVRVKMRYHFNNSLTFNIWLSHGIVVSLHCQNRWRHRE